MHSHSASERSVGYVFLMRARVANYYPTHPFRTVSPRRWVNKAKKKGRWLLLLAPALSSCVSSRYSKSYCEMQMAFWPPTFVGTKMMMMMLLAQASRWPKLVFKPVLTLACSQSYTNPPPAPAPPSAVRGPRTAHIVHHQAARPTLDTPDARSTSLSCPASPATAGLCRSGRRAPLPRVGLREIPRNSPPCP
jgi:hypothetical protein